MNYPSIRIEGAILSPDILDKLEESAGQKPSDFDFAPNAKVKDEIARAWADAQDYWRIFQRRLEGVKSSTPATSETRNLWIAPLLGLLGYQLEYQKRGVELNGKLYAISHRVINRGQTPIHIIDWREPAGLDRKPENATLRMSAHGLVQEYLNLHDELYGVVTNGRVLRLLRDSSRLVKLTYLEFDLERIFSDGLFADFAIFYRLLHATRLPAAPEVAAESLIEKYHQDSLDSGTRIRQGLSRAVEQAIREFANGFLDHPDNDTLRQLVRDEKIKPEAYYHHLLNLIYRLLFLLVIEERDLVYPAQTPRSQRQVYDDYYSLQRLRRLAEKRYLADRRYHDLWRALQTTFALFSAEGRGKKLGLTPLAGDLFHPDAIGPFNECTLGNDVLLGCLRALGLYQHPDKRQMLRVNYAALNVEELGSVYEGLLKLVPAFERVGSKTAFLLRPGADDTQSHYTADDLVQPLLKHSLDYLIAEKLEGAREIASKASGEIASKASREIGSGEIGRKKNDNQFLSGSYGVGEGDAVGGNLLPANPSISERGDVWIDLADSAGGGLDSGEYSRGVGARGDSRIYPLSEDSAGQPKGIGNTPDSQSTGRTGGRKVSVSNSGSVRRSGADDPLPDWFFTAQAEWDRERDREREIGSKKDRDVSPSRSSLPPYSLLAEKALLSLRVADISCGSGHILLAAARRIAVALAAARTGEDQPSPTAFRTAVRDVIRHCIYGVDLNPLAVELCKVALWLEAHNPGEPLNFLDHHIKCGNAIVGYVRPDDVARRGVPDEAFTTMTGDDKQVAATLRKRNKAEQKQKAQTVFEFAPARQQQFADVLRRWREIVTLPENTPAEISAKKEAYNAYAHSGEAWRLNQLAAIPIAQFYLPKTTATQNKVITDSEFQNYWRGDRTPQGQATGEAWGIALGKRFFHWFLEFPEIMAQGGFDCILGNPPYKGGQHLSGMYGYPFCEYVKWEYAPAGLSDLVAYFVRRIFNLLKPNGFTAFITTNSIKDGDIRKDGLDQVIRHGGTINFAVRGIKWPGQANLVVSLVSIHNGNWQGKRVLDNTEVPVISAYFEDSIDLGEPKSLSENLNTIFQGSIFLGDGFLLTHEEADNLLQSNPSNKEVIFPVINGQEVNNHPKQEPGRQIINFFDWKIEKAKRYELPFHIVEQKVKPFRATQNRTRNREVWWIYAEHRPGLNKGIQPLSQCFVAAATTKYLNFSDAPTNYVFLNTLYVFTTDRWDLYAVVQSTLHEVWARKYSGSLETRLRYSPSDCFDTFAFPSDLWQTANPALAAIGEQYHEHRRALMRQLWLGLTPIYNLFHAPDLTPDLVAKVSKQPEDTAEAGYHGLIELRRLHVALDHAIRDAYGWGGSEIANNEVGSREKALSPYPATLSLPLDHDFYEVETLPENDRVRYTISPSARKELLVRLLALNHQRAKEEKEGKKKVFVQENESKSQAPATLQLHPTEPPPPKLKQSTSVEPLTVSPSPIVAFTPPQGSFSQRLKRVHSLGQPQNQSELTELIAALGDEDGNIRWLAGSSLSRLGDLNVVHLLVAFLHTGPTEIAQQEGKRVLALIAQISDDEAVKETIQRSAIQNSKDF